MDDCDIIVIENFLNLEVHQNPINGSKVTAILLNGWILLIGGVSSGEGLGLRLAQEACFFMDSFIIKVFFLEMVLQHYFRKCSVLVRFF